MPVLDTINRAFRDFVRFTGDGKPNEPVGAPLPIGDPRSGTHNPGKNDWRTALIELAQTQGDPDALQDIIDDLGTKADLSALRTAVRGGTTASLSSVSGGQTVTATTSLEGFGYFAGIGARLTAPSTETGPVTLNVNGLGDIPVRDAHGAVLPAGAWRAGRIYTLVLASVGSSYVWRILDDGEPLYVQVERDDAATRANLWLYEGDASVPVLFASMDGQALLTTSGAAGAATLEVVTDDGQSNGEGAAYEGAATAYGSATIGSLLTLARGSSADVWLGIATGGGASVALDGGTITSIAPLIPQLSPSGLHGTTSSEGMARALLSRDPARAVAIWSNAEGGQTIGHLLPDAGSGYHGFDNAITAVSRAVAVKGGRERVVWKWMLMQQGESNTSTVDLGELHDLYRAELSQAASAITGQYEPVRMISFQMSSFYSASDGVRSILARAMDGAGVFFCGGPTYWVPLGVDLLHNTSVGQARKGELCAAIAKMVEETGECLPLHMVAAAVTGANQITVTLSEPAITETNSVVAAIENMGMTLAGGAIASVSLAGDQLVINTTGAASGVTAVNAALTGHASERAPGTIPRSNIRSQAGYGQFLSGGVIRKWLCHQSISIT